MPAIAWLAAAIAAGIAAYLVGWPAWRAYRAREVSDTNRERYLAWRGRADRRSAGARQRMTDAEQRRIYAGVALAVVAVAALLAFFATS